MAATKTALFSPFTAYASRVPTWAWHLGRVVSLASLAALIGLLLTSPETGLRAVWGLAVPLLPAVWLIAPGLWRNVCPFATMNQLPRLFGFTRGLTLTPAWRDAAYVIGLLLFLFLASARQVLFNESADATAGLLLGLLSAAFLGGVVFKGKSGWCSTFCPLLPVQRLYGQTPWAVLPNAWCKPCVGCAKSCYDFNPTVAQLADLYDDDPRYSGYRKFFAALLPGFVLGFLTMPAELSPGLRLVRLFVFAASSLGLFLTLQTFARRSAFRLVALFAATAITLFYAFGLPVVFMNLKALFGLATPDWVLWALRAFVVCGALYWLGRTHDREPRFLAKVTGQGAVRVKAKQVLSRHVANAAAAPEVTFQPTGKSVAARPDQPVLEVAEAAGLKIESGCRMGVCGADPIAVQQGMEHLCPVGDDEQATLERLGHASNTRMACMARVRGPVTVALVPDKPTGKTYELLPAVGFDPEVKRVVIVGNGIAGVTAADYVRRNHPTCEVHLVAREPHHLYNRMALARVVYGKSALHGLYLLPEAWYEEHQIQCWLNTRAVAIDRPKRQVALATGERLDYDRLVLAMGSRAFVPPIPGIETQGVFVLRDATDAVAVRGFVQERRIARVVVLGGGLLGLEGAYAVHKLGLPVTVIERGPYPLARQLDARAGELLTRWLAGLGIDVIVGLDTLRVQSDATGAVSGLELSDGRTLPAGLLLVCIGIRANTELAQAAGLTVGRGGVLVDSAMRTSDPAVYAVGDVAEREGQIGGLWTVGVEQAKVAAKNLTGLPDRLATFEPIPPVTMLKVTGIDVLSVGATGSEREGDLEVVVDEADAHRYRKLVLRDGAVIGGIVLGLPEVFPRVTAAVKARKDVAGLLNRLRAGDWDAL